MEEETIFKIGERVHYIPFEGADKSLYENGVVKDFANISTFIFVVYHCNGEWHNYQNYTAASTSKSQLRKGWV